jgi:Icc-related predicted phosphoesterase
MKLLCITDVHSDDSMLLRILHAEDDVDAVLLGGDITNFGSAGDAERLVLRVQSFCPTVLAVAGNCDSADIDQRLTELGVSLFRRGVSIDGIGFYGASAMPPWNGGMYEMSEQEIGDGLDAGRSQLTRTDRVVVLSHTPPRATRLDRTRAGQHVGSVAVRQLIDRTNPSLVVCGHIHEARGVDRLGPTTVVNCGPAFRGCFAVAELNETVAVQLRAVEPS